ncbi:MAG: hypothetical protein ACFE8E_04420 [Candidatus Hodarchaeota archaeon]
MICIHGLDKNNCPVCRISINTRPVNGINLDIINVNSLKPVNPFFKHHFENKNKSEKELLFNQNSRNYTDMLNIPKPKIPSQIWNSENRIFLEKLEKVNINNFDKFGVSKKIPLTKKELNLENKE